MKNPFYKLFNTWSDNARQAAVEARREHSGLSAKGMSAEQHRQEAQKWSRLAHSETDLGKKVDYAGLASSNAHWATKAAGGPDVMNADASMAHQFAGSAHDSAAWVSKGGGKTYHQNITTQHNQQAARHNGTLNKTPSQGTGSWQGKINRIRDQAYRSGSDD